MRLLILLLLCLSNSIFSETFDEFISGLNSSPVGKRKTVVNQFFSKKGATPFIENDTIVHFVWFGKADTVFITGNIQCGWGVRDTMNKADCGDEDLFYKTYVIPSDSRFNYIFIVDGQYRVDQKNPRIVTTTNGQTSEGVMPKFTADPILNYRPGIAHGTLDSITFTSRDNTLKSRQIKIYVPAGYSRLSDLPSVYIFNGFDALKFGAYKTVVDNIIADGLITPVIAVFIQPVDNMDEFIGGRRKNLTNAVCNELIPVIDSVYRTSKKASKRAVMGTSFSGNITYATALERTDLFLNVAAQSIIEGELYGVLASESDKKTFPKELKAYIDYGIFEYNGPEGNLLNSIKFLSGCINSYGIKHTFVEYHDGSEWQGWSRHTDDILKFFFGKEN